MHKTMNQNETPNVQKRLEQKSLNVGIWANLFMAFVGWWAYYETHIEAIFLDGNFSLIAAISCMAAIFISKHSLRRTETFPHGMYIYEPLYAILKALLTLGILIPAILSSITKIAQYYFEGKGHQLGGWAIVPYAITMIVLCFGLFFYYRHQNFKIHNISTILTAETKTAFVDGMLSVGVGIGIVVIAMVDEDGPFKFLLYTGDAYITIIICLLSFSGPVNLLKTSFVELTYGVITNRSIRREMTQAVKRHLPKGTLLDRCYIHKVGSYFRVSVHLKYETDVLSLEDFIQSRCEIEKELCAKFPSLSLHFTLP